jgi:ligand-binding sensor domain-containing protein/two-component sensor histidine kinase
VTRTFPAVARLATLCAAFSGAVVGAWLVAQPVVHAADLRSVLTGYTLSSWSQKDGLPSGSISALAQDPDGYLWVGTDEGPYRFDGVRFTLRSDAASPTSKQASVRAIHISRDGTVWIGYGGAGTIARVTNRRWELFGMADGLPESPVATIAEDATGNVWAGTAEGLYGLRDRRWHLCEDECGLTSEAMMTAALINTGRGANDRRQQLLVGSASGLFSYREDAKRFERIDLPGDIPRSITDDPRGTVLVTDQVGGFRRASDRYSPAEQVERGRGRQLLRDRRNNVWVGTAGQGLWRVRFDANGQVLFTERATALTGLLSDGITALLEDRDGNIWVGTPEGLSRLTPHKVVQITDVGLVGAVENSPDGSIWVGTVDELLRFSGGTTRAPTSRVALNGARLRALHVDPAGVIWVATTQGLSRLVDGRLVPITVPKPSDMPRQIDTITSDGHGGVWVFDLEHGLERWSGGRLRRLSTPEAVAASRVVATYTDSLNRAWFAFSSGQVAASDESGMKLFDADDGVNGGVYQAIYEDRHHVIWLGGTTGLTRFADGRFVTIRAGSGFPVNNLTAIADDDEGTLWIGSGLGIIRIGREECERAAADPTYQVQYHIYDRADGLAGLPFVYSTNRRVTRSMDGRLWFVTGRGLTVLDPRDLRTEEAPRLVRIEGIVVNDARSQAEPNIALPPRSDRLEIEYTAVDLTSPMKQRFRYQLEGFDAGWIDAGARRQAFYTNLPPKKYRFRIMGSDGEGGWTQPEQVWQFSIRPTFYQTAWFMAACIAGAVLLVGGAWRLHVGQVRHRFALLIGERARLSREIHDTLLQSLVGVALQFDAMANEVADADSDRPKERFVKMRRQVEEYIREARQSIWDLRSPKLQGQDLTAALREAGERAADGNGVGFTMSVKGESRRFPARTEEQVLRIGQEAVVNAVRHGAPQNVAVELDYEDARLTLRVLDDGRGFDSTAQAANGNGHYGLTSMRERAEVVGGTLTVHSIVGQGTRIEAIVPASPNA